MAADVAAYRAGVDARLRQAEAERAEAAVRSAEARKRRRLVLWSGAAVVAVLLAGVVTTLGGWRSAIEAAGRERLATVEALRQRDISEAERRYARAITDFVRDDFLALSSVEGQARFGGFDAAAMDKDIKMRDLLDRAATKLQERTDLAPQTAAELYWMVGVNYQGLGEFQKGVEYLERSVALLQQSAGPDAEQTLDAMNSLAVAYNAAGRMGESIRLLEQVRDARVAKLGADHPDTLTTLNNLAWAYRAAGRTGESIRLLEQVRDAQVAKRGADHPDTLATLNNLATAYDASGRTAEAIRLYEQVRDAQIPKLGADHPHTLATLHNLARAYKAAGRTAEAIHLYEQVRNASIVKFGADHPHTLATLNNLAVAYWSNRQLDRSIPMFVDLVKRSEAKLTREHPDTQNRVANLGVNYIDAGRADDAIPLLEEVYSFSRRYPRLQWVGEELLNAYARAGRADKAAGLVAELLAEARRTLPPDSPQLAAQLATFGYSYLQAGAPADAEPLLREALTIREATQPYAWTTANTRSMLGAALSGSDKFAEAAPLLLAGYVGMKQHLGRVQPDPPEAAALRTRLTEAVDRLIAYCRSHHLADEAGHWQLERDQLAPPL